MRTATITLTALVLTFAALFASCATVGAARPVDGDADPFAGKNWNAPRRNNMYDRWEFNTDGTFHFWHLHMGTPLDRGVYQYEAKNGALSITKPGTREASVYTYAFSGKTVTLTPAAPHSDGAAHTGAAAHTGMAGGGMAVMGALPETETKFTAAK